MYYMKSRSSSVEHVEVRRPTKLKSKIDLGTILGLHDLKPMPVVSYQLVAIPLPKN